MNKQVPVSVQLANGLWLLDKCICIYSREVNLVLWKELFKQLNTGNTTVMTASAVWFPLRLGFTISLNNVGGVSGSGR